MSIQPPLKVIVTGSRDWPRDLKRIIAQELHEVPAESLIVVHGGQTGADTLAAEVAAEAGWPVRRYAVDEAIDGPWPSCGPRRNQRMLDIENTPAEPVGLVMAFPLPRSKGTWDMVNRARRAGIPVHVSKLVANAGLTGRPR